MLIVATLYAVAHLGTIDDEVQVELAEVGAFCGLGLDLHMVIISFYNGTWEHLEIHRLGIIKGYYAIAWGVIVVAWAITWLRQIIKGVFR